MGKSVSNFLLLFIFPILIVFSSVGCGGGSAGTGTTTFTGKLLTTDNKPVQGATVSVVGSNEVATTDEKGQFTLSTADQSAPHQLQVQAAGVNASVVVPAATADESKIGVQLQLDTGKSTVSVKSVEVKVSLLGECEKYFLRSGDTLIQIKELPDSTKCTLQVATNSGSQPVGGILADLQRSTCSGTSDDTDSWISVASGRTRESGLRGRVNIDFTFFNDESHCRYRVEAPAADKNRTPLFFPIVTLRQQGK